MIEATYTQCKQLSQLGDLRETLEAMSNQPEWITETLTIADIQAIQQGGCSSGAYMPAVTYHTALEIMVTHGDYVSDYLLIQLGEMPEPQLTLLWSQLAVFYISYAVELWCGQFDLDGVDWD